MLLEVVALFSATADFYLAAWCCTGACLRAVRCYFVSDQCYWLRSVKVVDLSCKIIIFFAVRRLRQEASSSVTTALEMPPCVPSRFGRDENELSW